jgi:hypothetical protein
MDKIECQVVLLPTEKQSNIVFVNQKLDWLGQNQQKNEEKKFVSFVDDKGNVLATSLKEDGFPNIGIDFLWTYVKANGKINSVFLFEDLKDTNNKVRTRNNGDVVVARSDEKEFTEKDVVDMLSYAIAHSGISSKEMNQKIEETIKWFRSYN